MVAGGRKLMIVEGAICDVAGFAEKHPGGESLINAYLGKDITGQFNGGVYDHSEAARHWLDTLAVGVVG